jgi:hypothetical protein
MSRGLYYKALMSKCVAERDEAMATIDTYLNNSVGIGEHPQMVEEAMGCLEKLASAEDKIETLEKNFKQPYKLNND